MVDVPGAKHAGDEREGKKQEIGKQQVVRKDEWGLLEVPTPDLPILRVQVAAQDETVEPGILVARG